jgi:hypothetical protein
MIVKTTHSDHLLLRAQARLAIVLDGVSQE